MRYSFKNTLCGLAIVIAAGFIAEKAFAQSNITLVDEDIVPISSDMDFAESTEISLFGDDADPFMEKELITPPTSGDVSVNIDTNENEETIQISIDTQEDPFAEEVISLSSPEEEVEAIAVSQDMPVAEAVEAVAEIAATPSNADVALAPVEEVAASPLTAGAVGKLFSGGVEEATSPLANSLTNIDNEFFSELSDIEKETTYLNLELKKEKLANEIAAVKSVRQKAKEEEEARKEAKERKRIEWENEQERLKIIEEQKLVEAQTAFEKLRQEKVLNEYKATMLASTQKWIKMNADTFKLLTEKKEENKELMVSYKNDVSKLKQEASKIKLTATAAKINFDKVVAEYKNQISILKGRLQQEILKNQEREAAKNRKNPFAGANGEELNKVKYQLSNDYAILEIVGMGDELAARIVNNTGRVFMVKVGTTLQNGYTIDEIAETYLSAVKNNEKNYLYFAAGGASEIEPPVSEVAIPSMGGGKEADAAPSSTFTRRTSTTNTSQGIPSLSRGMVIR